MSSYSGFLVGVVIWIILIAIIIVCVKFYKKIKLKIKLKHSTCPQCNKIYEYPKDFQIIASDLKWREEEWTGTTDNGNSYKYPVRIFYRIVTFDFKCSKCGNEHFFNKTYDVYSSQSNHSQNAAEELALLKDLIKKDFAEEVFKGKDIKIVNLEV
jgi:hypothetical protein